MRFIVQGKSMEPTFKEGDRLFTLPLLTSPRQGDVVIIKHPFIDKYIVKRIEQKRDDGNIMVTGDNCNESEDSRSFGAIRRKDIIGKVWFDY